MPRLFPVQPDFDDATRAERRVWEDLRDQLPDDAALFHHVPLQLGSREGEIDLLVAWPGVGLAVIEVKGGRVVRDAEGWWQGPADTAHRIDPVRQVQDARHMLRRYLGQHRSPASQARCVQLVAFPNVRVPQDWEAPDCPRQMVIDNDDLVGLGLRVRRAIEDLGGGQRPLTHEGLASLEALVAGALPSQRDHLVAAAEHDQRVEQMTRDQAHVLDLLRYQRRIRVVGGAGSGKTWLALAQARRLARTGERVALVCYSRGLARFLERVTQEWPVRERPAFVGLFHELPVRWGAEPGQDDDSDYWERRLPLRLGELAAARHPGSLFDSVVVDEAQDFGELWWPALLACLRHGGARGDGPEGGLYVFMDDAQRVFPRQGHVPIDLPPFTLQENIRSTKRIAQLFGSLSHEEVRPRGMVGEPVRLVEATVDGAVPAADDVVEALLDEGWEPGQIALLTTQHRHPEQRNAVDVGGWQHYWDGFLDEEDVFYGHVLGFKGLERQVVVLAVNGFRDVQRARELLYVGLSRARALLVVVGPRALVEEVGGTAVSIRLHQAEPWAPCPLGVSAPGA
ncbi:NERD domain-containing protein [Actinotalea ferrariae]|uniref:nuclease-related domain-containing DEAD/DEAH box helicase n=1 Tax=Actinotalea ferrariae TaxID=1386098 RepID=UPI001C8B7EF2|nr:NERD domain-containing protein [Actinotalea ferrariae]MBX9245344.1 NERD domain-containing protein [Actinotalea ferrariae]